MGRIFGSVDCLGCGRSDKFYGKEKWLTNGCRGKGRGGEGVVWKKKEQKWEEMMTYEGPKY